MCGCRQARGPESIETDVKLNSSTPVIDHRQIGNQPGGSGMLGGLDERGRVRHDCYEAHRGGFYLEVVQIGTVQNGIHGTWSDEKNVMGGWGSEKKWKMMGRSTTGGSLWERASWQFFGA